MEEDMSNVLGKFQDILKEKNIDLNSILGSSSNTQSNSTTNNSDNSATAFDFDINTILKMKTILDKMNNQNNPRNNLLYSLKPFLKEDKRQKLEQYIKISNILSIIEFLSNDENPNSH